MNAENVWEQIPCAPKYEINRCGDVRNIKTKRTIKPWVPKSRKGDKQVYLRVVTGGKPKSFHVAGLLYYTHGIIPRRKTHARIPVPVVVSHGKNEVYYFESMRQAAQLLAARLKRSAGYVHACLSKNHPKEFRGWRIKYLR